MRIYCLHTQGDIWQSWFIPTWRTMGEDLDMWGRIALEFDIVFDWTIGAIWHNWSKQTIMYKTRTIC